MLENCNCTCVPVTTPKHKLRESNGALVVLNSGEAYIQVFGNLMDGVKTISLDDYDDFLVYKNGVTESLNVKKYYSNSKDGEFNLNTKNREKLWQRPLTPSEAIMDAERKRRKLYCKAFAKYGVEAQQDIAIEEMSELTKAIIKLRRANNSNQTQDYEALYDNLYEEIADVSIMVEQLQTMFACDTKVLNYKNQKLDRLSERLEK